MAKRRPKRIPRDYRITVGPKNEARALKVVTRWVATHRREFHFWVSDLAKLLEVEHLRIHEAWLDAGLVEGERSVTDRRLSAADITIPITEEMVKVLLQVLGVTAMWAFHDMQKDIEPPVEKVPHGPYLSQTMAFVRAMNDRVGPTRTQFGTYCDLQLLPNKGDMPDCAVFLQGKGLLPPDADRRGVAAALGRILNHVENVFSLPLFAGICEFKQMSQSKLLDAFQKFVKARQVDGLPDHVVPTRPVLKRRPPKK